jgi:hypothetical protein
MRSVIEAVLILVIGLVGASVAYVATSWPFTDLGQGELRCEEGGAVVIHIAGKDYAVNGAASSRYPPVQQVWNSATYPNTDIDRLIVKGLTLCHWGAPLPSIIISPADWQRRSNYFPVGLPLWRLRVF